MAIATRDIRALATRVHQRWLEYRRRNPGRSVPITDTLSRILEHSPAYRPLRPRAEHRQRPPLHNPGVFTLQAIADALETTVGDLLGEPSHTSIRDAVSPADRRKLRDAVLLLRELFDLDDDALGAPPARIAIDRFDVAPGAFIVHDYDYPEPLHVWMMHEGATDVREVRDPRRLVVRIMTSALEPELPRGSKAVIDTTRPPADGALAAVYVPEKGGLIGRCRRDENDLRLERGSAAISLDPEAMVLGSVTGVVTSAV